MWLNQLSRLAPCQCLTSAGMTMTLPGSRLTASLPSSWYQPSPAVQISSCPPPLGGVVDMPVVPAPGLEGDVGQKQPVLRAGQGIEIGPAGKVPGKSVVGRAQAKHVLFLKCSLVHDLHATYLPMLSYECGADRRPGVDVLPPACLLPLTGVNIRQRGGPYLHQ